MEKNKNKNKQQKADKNANVQAPYSLQNMTQFQLRGKDSNSINDKYNYIIDPLYRDQKSFMHENSQLIQSSMLASQNQITQRNMVAAHAQILSQIQDLNHIQAVQNNILGITTQKTNTVSKLKQKKQKKVKAETIDKANSNQVFQQPGPIQTQHRTMPNSLGPLGTAFNLAQINQQNSQLNYQNKQLGHLGVVPPQNQNDSLITKKQNYYSVINQTLISQAALNMNNSHFQPILNHLSTDQDNKTTREPNSANIHGGKRTKIISQKGGSVAKSLKDGIPFSASTMIGSVDPIQTFQQQSSNEFNAQTRVEWRNAKKKASGNYPQNNQYEVLMNQMQDQQQKQNSRRNSSKKGTAAQLIMDRMQKGIGHPQQNSLLPIQALTPDGGPGSATKKSQKLISTGFSISGRNRTATALLIQSQSQNVSETFYDFNIQKNHNEEQPIINGIQRGQMIGGLISELQEKQLGNSNGNIPEKKTRMKTSQGTNKSNAITLQHSKGNISSKLPLMQTLDHPQGNQSIKVTGTEGRPSQSLQLYTQPPTEKGRASLFNDNLKPLTENHSISDDGGNISETMHGASGIKKTIGFVKKTRTHVGNSQAMIGANNAVFLSNQHGQISPITSTAAKKQKKQKSASNAISQVLNAPINLTQPNLSWNQPNQSPEPISPQKEPSLSKEPILLPHTGIEYPFLKKRTHFIKDAPDFELVQQINGQNNFRFLIPNNSSMPYTLQQRPNDFNPRYVYDCTFIGSSVQISGQGMQQITKDRDLMSANQQINGKYFEKLANYYNLKGPNDTTLIFESRFESGNLSKVTQISEFEYDLELKQDHGATMFLTQWFYFRVTNTKKNQVYKFNIINLIKPDSLYNHGMKPLLYSKKTAQQKSIGWHRGGNDIRYYQSKKRSTVQSATLYTLSFTFEFNYDQDHVYFAHCYPYTYSDCILFLKRVCLPQYCKDRLRRTALCKTKAGNSCEMLIITNFTSTQDQIADRKCVIISSRVHPGESNSSFIMEGIVEFILSNEKEARHLRDTYVFKIIPMLNPDGVIVGNYRCSLSGLDLNRQWQTPSVKASPEIASMKEMVRKTLECRDIHLFVDIHGHSRAQNLFMYGCQPTQGTNLKPSINDRKNNGQVGQHKEKVLPVMLARAMDCFSFQETSFVIQKSKEATGRVVMHREFGIINSYTLEVSFCGSTQGMYKDTHFSQKLLKEMGSSFCKTLATFSDIQQWKEAHREAELLMNNGGSVVLNPLTKAANAGSLAMQMHFEPLENKNTNSSLANPLGIGVVNQKQRAIDSLIKGNNSTDFRQNQVK